MQEENKTDRGAKSDEDVSRQQTNDAKKPEKVYATIDDFQKLEIRLGTVLSVEIVEGADKLYKLSVDLGEASPRQILSGIREYVQPEDLLGKQFPFVANLAPRMIRGLESNGMILAGSDDSGLALLNPTKTLTNGTRLR
ncbi:MAG: methionyl-tRNA synthetase [Patescibacteria group bacterium]|nr:methionyl-tRNA synthetase [Patescibacteria group bacterium]